MSRFVALNREDSRDVPRNRKNTEQEVRTSLYSPFGLGEVVSFFFPGSALSASHKIALSLRILDDEINIFVLNNFRCRKPSVDACTTKLCNINAIMCLSELKKIINVS